MDGLTNKKGNIRKTVHQYNRFFKGNFGQVREQLIIEATWLGNYEPFTNEQITCYLFDLMKLTGQEKLIKEYRMKPFKVRVLSIERTFCEKIMSLVRFSKMDNPYVNLSNKIRHIYDLHLMLCNDQVQSFFESSRFYKMIIKVGKDDIVSYKNNNMWLETHPCSSLIFRDPEKTWSQIRNTYHSIFKDLVIGDLPDENDLISTLKKIEKRMNPIVWDI